MMNTVRNSSPDTCFPADCHQYGQEIGLTKWTVWLQELLPWIPAPA
jgi:hypothetical protein